MPPDCRLNNPTHGTLLNYSTCEPGDPNCHVGVQATARGKMKEMHQQR